MRLSEFSYKNILSYGNKLQTFKFDDKPGLILVEGENGAGKSSIKEALTVSIYGRSAIRKMKDIPNWINRNAQTSVKFTTTSGETIELTRGIDPNFSDIKINGATFNLPDKRKVDEFIEDELAKIPFSVFCNTISLSFDDFKVHLQCFRIIPQQGTHILTIKYDYIKPCVVLKELGVQVNLEVKETERCEEKIQFWTIRKKKISGFHLCSS